MTGRERQGCIRLNRAEQRLLVERFALPAALREQLDRGREVVEVWISADEAEELRDQAGDLFQTIGLGPDSAPTPDGHVLDSLIDKLFTG